MDTRRQAELLARLRLLDQIEAEALGEAIGKVGDDETAAELTRLKADHERHLREIDGLFGECGEYTTVEVPDAFETAAQRRLDSVRNAPDARTALHALLATEQAEAEAYRRADAMRLPSDEGPTISAHLADEQRHVETLRQRLGGGSARG